jgi:hypothetical protein
MNRSGAFEVHLQLPAGAPADAAKGALDVVGAFARAIELGMFPSGTVSAVDLAPESVPPTFKGTDVPSYAFRVLDGMLAYHSNVVQPLDGWRVGPRGQDLCASADPVPAMPDPPPAWVQMQIGGEKTTEPLLVAIELARDPDAAARARITDELGIWHRLLQGGYPAPDFGRGESGTSQPTIGARGRSTIQYAVDMWSSSLDAFVPLINLVARWQSTGLGVAGIEIST